MVSDRSHANKDALAALAHNMAIETVSMDEYILGNIKFLWLRQTENSGIKIMNPIIFITPEGGFSPPDRTLGPWFKTTGFQLYSLSVGGLVRQLLCHQLSAGGCLLLIGRLCNENRY